MQQVEVLRQFYCENRLIDCERLREQESAQAYAFLLSAVKELSGYNDAQACIGGEAGGCVWTIIGVMPLGKAKALKLADDAAVLGEFGAKSPLGERIASCVYKSFSGDTKVLMADGSAKPIKDVKVGDKVLATDPKNGKKQPRAVTHVWVHEDQLVDLKLGNGDRLTTTEDHPFWNAAAGQWQEARELPAGGLLFTGTPAVQTVRGLDWGTIRQSLAYNLTVAGIHTYYVLAGNSPVLVHNCPSGGDGVAPRDVHGLGRTAERGVDVDHVWKNGEMYIQEDGQIVKVLDNGNGTSSVVVRDMSNPSGAPTTTIPNMTSAEIDRKIERGIWE